MELVKYKNKNISVGGTNNLFINVEKIPNICNKCYNSSVKMIFSQMFRNNLFPWKLLHRV